MTNELKSVTQAALDAFWEVVANSFPQARTGDLSPGATIDLDTSAEEAVREWVGNNVPGRAA